MRKSNTTLSNCLTTTNKEKYLPSGAACSVKIFASPAVTDNGIPCTLPAATLICKLRCDGGPCTTAYYAPITKKFIIIIIIILVLQIALCWSQAASTKSRAQSRSHHRAPTFPGGKQCSLLCVFHLVSPMCLLKAPVLTSASCKQLLLGTLSGFLGCSLVQIAPRVFAHSWVGLFAANVCRVL